MIIGRAPLRASFFGGGTDFPWFYREHSGMSISIAINKHVYISAHPMFESTDILLKYSDIERVKSARFIRHNIFREALTLHQMSGIDIGVSSDVPSGTGLGSSSSFTVALLHVLRQRKTIPTDPLTLASEACYLEVDVLQQFIGKQDQFAAAFGGVNRFTFLPNNEVQVSPLLLSDEARTKLNHSLFLVRVGSTRDANSVLKHQHDSYLTDPSVRKAHIRLLNFTKEIPDSIFEDLEALGTALNTGWQLKKETSPKLSHHEIDDLISQGLKRGAYGAKLLGAGVSGFLLFVVDPNQTENFMTRMAERLVVPLAIDYQGSMIVFDGD